jgi:protein O-GlcNAc transferase
MTIEGELNAALAAYQSGNLEEAKAQCNGVLRSSPAHPLALELAGVVAFQSAQYQDSITLFARLIATNQVNENAYLRLGAAYLAAGQPADAVAQFNEALRRNAAMIDASRARAEAYVLLGFYADAVADCDAVLRHMPNDAGAHFFRGHALSGLGRAVEALTSFDKAAALAPNDPGVEAARGRLLLSFGRNAEAVASLSGVVARQPENFDAHMNLGAAQLELDQWHAALVSFEKVTALLPDSALAHFNRGLALKGLKRYADATEAFGHAVQLDPKTRLALGEKYYCAMMGCHWRDYSIDVPLMETATARGEGVCQPFTFLAASGAPELQRACMESFAINLAPSAPLPRAMSKKAATDKIHLAFVSSDFFEHPVGLLVAEVLEQIDRTKFSVTAVAYGPVVRDAMNQRLTNAVDEMIDIRAMSDENAAAMMARRGIDIAIDLTGSTYYARTRLFALRPAPIQVNFLGYPGTMGASYYDYIVADSFVIPPGDEAHYCESVVRLPEVFQPNPATRAIAGRAWTREQAGLPAIGVVLCCFNNTYKITPPIFDVWMKILKATENSVLWLSDSNAEAKTNLRREAIARGVSPHRLVFAPRVAALADHLSRIQLADLFLDTWPYNAHTTAGDSLWAGVPVLTYSAGAFAGRVAGSLLCAVGLPELVTDSRDAYEALALKLGKTPELRADIRHRLGRNIATHPLFNSIRYTRHLEAAFAEMYRRYHNGERPKAFDIAPLP